jgi:hypothetical protein
MIDIKTIISKIKHPFDNKYYENDSADGFAFLGCAKVIVGLGHEQYLKEIKDRDYCLNAAWHGEKDTQYTYTLWCCIEYLIEAEQKSVLKDLYQRLDNIGIYPDGYMRYCSEEINYRVPNVTSASALISVYREDFESAEKFVKLLRDDQVDGNWKYCKLDNTLIGGKDTVIEDAYHLAMMIYHLKKIESNSSIITRDITEKAILAIKNKNYAGNGKGKIDLAASMIYLASIGFDSDIESEYLKKTLECSVNHSNFRTRAMAAFCLAKGANASGLNK